MYLKTLELHGFKSFPEKTVLHFNAGATVIVGPNGSGKSNITDAMRWVLGELSTKNIRGSKMEDVIFVGADGHRPMGFAEVSVTFDDTEEPRTLNSVYDVITVTRRYYRAGESEYFINRKPCRLKDIYELFMNTGIGREGYSIIGQGKIAEIIAKKSDDRRGIFEETAGISKFRYRKQETQKKLAETEDNMVRITDIFSEIESRIGPLERDAKKARRYLELYGEKKELDVSLWLYDSDKLRGDIDKTRADCRMSQHELDLSEDTKAEFEAKNDRLYSASVETKEKAQKLYESIREDTERLHQLENSFKVLENDTEHTKSSIEQLARQKAELSEKAKSASENILRLKEKLEKSGKVFSSAEKELFEMNARREEILSEVRDIEVLIDNQFEEQKALEKEAADTRVRLDVLKNTVSDRENRQGSLISDIEKQSADVARLEKEEADIRQTVALYKAASDEASEKMKECDAESAEVTEALDRDRLDRSSVSSQIMALDSRIGALKRMSENFDGYNNSVKYVMNESSSGRLPGIMGPVSHLIKVKDRYIIAVETALGANLQNVIVRDEAAAKSAIASLKRSGNGRATFYPITTVRAGELPADVKRASEYPGFVEFADRLVECDSKYSGVIGYLLSRIPVFDTIDNAADMARDLKWRVRAVTLDGQQVNAGGSFTGGSVRRDSGVLTRNSHIAKLSDDKSALEKESEEIAKKIKEGESRLALIAGQRASYEEKFGITDALLRTEMSAESGISAKISVARSVLEDLKGELSHIDETKDRGKRDLEKLSASLDDLTSRAEAIAETRKNESIRASELEDEAAKLFEKLSEIKIKMAELRKDGENLESLILTAEAEAENAEREISRRESEREEFLKKIADNEAGIEEKKKEADVLRDTLAKEESERRGLEEGSLDYERRLNEIRRKLDEIAAKKEILFVAHTKNENKLANLTAEAEKMTARLWDEYELTQIAAEGLDLPPVTAEKRPEVFRRLSELKSSIKSLGHVNPDAIDEYAEQKERYDHLKSQIEDLTRSKTELEKIIESIETEMKTMFTETFDRVNENFKQVFKELFGGGSAHLSLTDPENVLTSGIEISAAPPGKMVKNLSLLSGGEQSFVAIALLFALIRVNPSPFCIFDEIEAALDEVNVVRVANYVKRYSKELQMIVISHRRGMMEVADTLYGVTMPKSGISKVFVLDVGSVSEKTIEENSLVE